MISLSCETSTLLGSVAIHRDGQLLIEKSLMRQGSHSDSLNLLINECLDLSNLKLGEIDIFATGLGPGSFTGIRISFNTAKTFSYVYNKPLCGIDSLKNLAYLNRTLFLESSTVPQEICCAINAFKNMVYIATYKIDQSTNSLVTLHEPQVLRVQNLKDFIKSPVLFVGDAHLTYESYLNTHLNGKLIRHAGVKDYPTADALGQLISLENQKSHWSKLLPLYLRASEAEENLSGIKFQPL